MPSRRIRNPAGAGTTSDLGVDPTPKTLGDFLTLTPADSKTAFSHESSAASELYNPGYPSSQEMVDGSIVHKSSDTRDHFLSPTEGIQDLSPGARETLASYAVGSQETVNRYHSTPNSFAPTPPTRRGSVIPKISDEKAYAPTAESSGDDVRHFDALAGGQGATKLASDRHTVGGGFFGSDALKTIISKDGVDVAGGYTANDNSGNWQGPFDGNDVNRVDHDSEGNIIETNLTREIDKVLDETNRFSPNESATPYIKDKGTTDELAAYSRGLWSIQTGKGDRSKTIQAGLGKYDPEAKHVTVQDLQVMALQTLISAGGHNSLQGSVDIGSDFSGLADLAALIPSVSQIGAAQPSVEELRIIHSEKAAQLGFNPNVGHDDIILVQEADIIFGLGPNGRVDGLTAPANCASYGGMNSYIEWFDGPAPMGMMFITLYGLLVTSLLGSALDSAMSLASPSASDLEKMTIPESPKTLGMGSRMSAESADSIATAFLKLFGIYQTENNWAGCVMRGLMAFYGVSKPIQDISFNDALDTAVNIIMAPGYYAIITKQVLRDVEQIIDAAAGFGQIRGVTSGITQIFKLVDALFSSTTFKFINTMAQIGDQMYRSKFSLGQIAHKGAKIVKYGDEDKVVLNPRTRMTSQSSYKSNGAWIGKYNLFSFGSILLPNPLTDKLSTNIKLMSDGKGLDGLNIITDPLMLADEGSGAKWVSTGLENPRISSDTVKAVEDSIDNEYMPFYIHDIRTNEIIAMPAFISSVSDSFSADYSDSHGYGRTDPVKIYSNTTRSIDMTFKLAAMSPEDHKYMWYVINRLVAMMYPQRSMGRMRLFENNTKGFIQPFSQVPTASPLVRIRVGDLLASNYSARNFGRIFGYPSHFRGEGSAITTADVAKETQASFASVNEKNWEFLQKSHQDFVSTFATGEFSGDILLKLGTSFTYSGGTDEKPQTFQVQARHVKGTIALQGGAKVGSTAKYVCKLDLNGIAGGPSNPITFLGGPDLRKIVRLQKPNDLEVIITAENAVTFGVSMTPEEHEKRANEIRDEAEAKYTGSKDLDNKAAYTDFMKPEKNALARSFEITKGRGLAGFITQMSLGYDGSPWEIKKTQRAPQFVEITMSFSPIHDLPLGLDYRGRLIAPSHPVGLAHTNPWVGINEATAADEAQTPEGIQQEVLQDEKSSKYDEQKASEKDGADGTSVPSGPEAPSSPLTLGGFDPMKLAEMAGSLEKLKDLI